MEISNLYEELMEHFKIISAIPRGSGNEKEVDNISMVTTVISVPIDSNMRRTKL